MSETRPAVILSEHTEALLAASRSLGGSVEQLANAIGRSGGKDLGPRATAPAAAANLTEAQRRICERVINVFETGTIAGKYDAISIFRDGPNRIRQITYGRSQTTEYGNLRELVQMYVEAGGRYSEELSPYVALIGRAALVDDAEFKSLLRLAGKGDPVMRQAQDAFFERRYFTPAVDWAISHGFIHALSKLVVYDSFIHSGSILKLLRARFPALPPSRGGNERTWIRQYVETRHNWLTNHDNPDVRPSNYRTRDLAREINRDNWELDRLPFMANGVPVDDRDIEVAAALAGLGTSETDGRAIPYLGDTPVRLSAPDGEVWCEVGLLPNLDLGVTATETATSELANLILAHPGIILATTHASGNSDNANARQNIEDAAAGRPVARSAYRSAPGGTVPLDRRMLHGILTLADRFSFFVTEVAGGSHSPNSRHYAGIAVDFGIINGRRITVDHPDASAFQDACRSLGASEVLGPGNSGHDTHVHAAWPRTA